jgi:hypothetical protein
MKGSPVASTGDFLHGYYTNDHYSDAGGQFQSERLLGSDTLSSDRRSVIPRYSEESSRTPRGDRTNGNTTGCRFFEPPRTPGTPRKKCECINHERDERHERKVGEGSHRESRESARMKDGNCSNVIRVDSRDSRLFSASSLRLVRRQKSARGGIEPQRHNGHDGRRDEERGTADKRG